MFKKGNAGDFWKEIEWVISKKKLWGEKLPLSQLLAYIPRPEKGEGKEAWATYNAWCRAAETLAAASGVVVVGKKFSL